MKGAELIIKIKRDILKARVEYLEKYVRGEALSLLNAYESGLYHTAEVCLRNINKHQAALLAAIEELDNNG